MVDWGSECAIGRERRFKRRALAQVAALLDYSPTNQLVVTGFAAEAALLLSRDCYTLGPAKTGRRTALRRRAVQ